jgi:hypothetical protein
MPGSGKKYSMRFYFIYCSICIAILIVAAFFAFKSNNEPGDRTKNECGFQRSDFIKVCEKVHIKQFCASGIKKAERK